MTVNTLWPTRLPVSDMTTKSIGTHSYLRVVFHELGLDNQFLIPLGEIGLFRNCDTNNVFVITTLLSSPDDRKRGSFSSFLCLRGGHLGLLLGLL